MLVLDPMAVFFKLLLIGASLVVVGAFRFSGSRELAGLGQGEFYALLLGVTFSNLLMASANDLAMLYLALEMVSIASYVMVAYLKGDRMSNEASLKYILFGAVSTGGMLYGLSLLYGMTGSTNLSVIRDVLAAGAADANRLPLFVVALLVFAGFGFKTASVPFHFWCPDVYQGAPTPVTAFLSVAPKAAGFAMMLRFFFQGLATDGRRAAGTWPAPSTGRRSLMVISVLTMTLGNVAALTQTNMKRLLAYSSIAHAGYILMGVVALSENGARAMMVYLLAYLFMNLGAFLVVTLIHNQDGTFDLRDYPGLYRRAPFLTVAMAVFLLSLMGIPPLVGFMGKLYVFAAVIESGRRSLVRDRGRGQRRHRRLLLRARAEDDDHRRRQRGRRRRSACPDGRRVGRRCSLAANIVPLLFWSRIEGWAQASLSLYAGQ